ncbi:hypothetical protein FC26_GL000902 [Paucilactobacillus vaccinostercus DSM 20634]|uniref:Exonuclease SbcC n=2 Tax=Paucilactobacillus vaccinostercus TaxID=176291 RepID=A0A0R2A4M1_9LACO|nr:hypothetical protein [Paucilactobacillus vaccinostercus]KRM62168.1 hypothetical protein FC26_GL000902 [Paucilactobacillus vaccinostercus DSM 20634]
MIMTNIVDQDDHKSASSVIDEQISLKITYLQKLQQAVADHDDRQVFALLDNQRYTSAVLHRENQENNISVVNLVDNLSDELSNFLSENLIKYLGKAYPFFYYEEFQHGHFKIYFGNWWDRREFGELDVLNIRFVFDQTEYQKLTDSFELAKENKRYNSGKIEAVSKENDYLQGLIDNQKEREAQKAQLQDQLKEVTSRSGMPWESGKQKEARQDLIDQLSTLEDQDQQARDALKTIKDNESRVLALSKENTILSYEQKSILDTFGSFADFEAANRNLYADYLDTLSNEKQVADRD